MLQLPRSLVNFASIQSIDVLIRQVSCLVVVSLPLFCCLWLDFGVLDIDLGVLEVDFRPYCQVRILIAILRWLCRGVDDFDLPDCLAPDLGVLEVELVPINQVSGLKLFLRAGCIGVFVTAIGGGECWKKTLAFVAIQVRYREQLLTLKGCCTHWLENIFGSSPPQFAGLFEGDNKMAAICEQVRIKFTIRVGFGRFGAIFVLFCGNSK